MCGIAGVRRFGELPISAEEINILLQSLEHRGNHATGIALMVRGQIQLLKAPEPAWTFCAEDETKKFLAKFLPDASIAILHTRFATIGNPDDNRNNHPMFLGHSAVVHNGSISNQEYMFDQLKVPRSCETDSDVFRAVLDKQGMTEDAVKTMNKFNGSAAIAAISQDDPETLILARSGSPLIYGFTDDKLWWASEIGAIQRATRPWSFKHGLWGRKFRSDLHFFAVPDNTAYILHGDDLKTRLPFKTCVAYHAPNYNMRATYQDKKDEWKRKSRLARLPATTTTFTHKTADCPNPKCQTPCEIPIERKFAEFECPDCKWRLTLLDSAKPDAVVYSVQP